MFIHFIITIAIILHFVFKVEFIFINVYFYIYTYIHLLWRPLDTAFFITLYKQRGQHTSTYSSVFYKQLSDSPRMKPHSNSLDPLYCLPLLKSPCDGAHGVRHGSITLPRVYVGAGAHGDRHATNALPRLHVQSGQMLTVCVARYRGSVSRLFVCARRAVPDTDVNRRSASGVSGSEPAFGLILFRLFYE